MIKSIPTKDSQFPQLPKCFEIEFGPQKSRVLACTYISSSVLVKTGWWGGGGGQCFLLGCEKILYDIGLKYIMNTALAELKIATNMVANATKIFSLATKNSGLVATLATRFFFDLDLK